MSIDIREAIATLEALARVGPDLESSRQQPRLVPQSDAGSHVDGTQESPSERRRRIAEARYGTLIEQIPAVTFLASLAGGDNEIYVSPQIESLLGFTQEEWVSDPVLWYRQTYPDDRDRVSRKFAALCLNGEPFRDVVRVISRSGELVWVHAEARLVRDDVGQLLFLQGVGFDVTEQFRGREAREQLIREQAARAEADRERDRLRQVFNSLPAAITMLRGAQHVVEFMNPLALQLAGDRADLIGRPFREAFVELAEQVSVRLDAVVATGEPFFAQELRVGEPERFFNFIVQPLHDYRGPFLLTHAVDVTEQVLSRRAVEGALGLRDEFISIASHELRTPVAALQVQAQLALRRVERHGEIEPQKVVQLADAINNQASRLTRLVGQLLDVSRLEAGKLGVEREPTDVVRLVREVVENVRLTTEEHALVLDAPDSVMAYIDPLRVEQVISNLLSNAVKYSPEGGTIEVVLRVASPELVEISIRDHGLGIPLERRDHIFERFYQAHNSGHRSGLGLGLYICRQLVEMHNGSIHAEFPSDGGSRFVVRLPLGVIPEPAT